MVITKLSNPSAVVILCDCNIDCIMHIYQYITCV